MKNMGGIYLGSEDFVNKSLGNISKEFDTSYIPKIHYKKMTEKLPIIEYEKIAAERNDAIYLVYNTGKYSLKEIGEHFNLHYSTISRIVSQKYKKTKGKA
ncbi:hypothetical protein Lade_1995 [Legionella adelaidensis]|uniref:Uncharacterized protein n=1 Tax=Legionella adelaidensis TaxID=45056 RepID=A0A0W0R0Z5_9GAMM|nr:hypothetical protein [Legionella adelaidensis]KTC64701.1 hypothetical protein Lade_1995 [Legionella adelaidensis]